jgi:hypothetical protein
MNAEGFREKMKDEGGRMRYWNSDGVEHVLSPCMTRYLSACLGAAALATASWTTLAADERHDVVSIQARNGAELKTVGAFDTEVRLVLAGTDGINEGDESRYDEYPYREESLGWVVAKTERGSTIRVAFGEKRKGWYLSFDPDAPEQGVFLVKKPTAGSYWDFDRYLAQTEVTATPIRARAAGHDWQLDVENTPETYLRPKPYRSVVTLSKLKLSKGRGTRFLIDFFGK